MPSGICFDTIVEYVALLEGSNRPLFIYVFSCCVLSHNWYSLIWTVYALKQWAKMNCVNLVVVMGSFSSNVKKSAISVWKLVLCHLVNILEEDLVCNHPTTKQTWHVLYVLVCNMVLKMVSGFLTFYGTGELKRRILLVESPKCLPSW